MSTSSKKADRRGMKFNEAITSLTQPAQRLYDWFSAHDTDGNVRYVGWENMSAEQRAQWMQAAGAALGVELRDRR